MSMPVHHQKSDANLSSPWFRNHLPAHHSNPAAATHSTRLHRNLDSLQYHQNRSPLPFRVPYWVHHWNPSTRNQSEYTPTTDSSIPNIHSVSSFSPLQNHTLLLWGPAVVTFVIIFQSLFRGLHNTIITNNFKGVIIIT